jgi:3-deoxy-D-manno-octulosonic-acid transferase
MMRILYNIVFPPVFLAALPAYLLRMVRRGGFRRDFAQRFARYSPELLARFRQGPWFWVHAVSVGELLVALKLIGELHRRHPDWRFALSSTTSTAHALALDQQADWITPIYTPVDFPAFVRRALDAVRPRAIILTESEMWPNFVWQASDRRIPVLLVNARVSPRSARRYRRFAPLLRPVTRHLDAVGIQEPGHADLWSHVGIPPDRLHLTGSVKYDPVAASRDSRDFQPVLAAWGLAAGTPLLLAGSTHEGEEDILASALQRIRSDHPSARLIIAPRHVERTPAIVARLDTSGLRTARRTATPDGSSPDILILDTTGELRDWYACADVVFIGKSLAGYGGQNPVEAILAGRPVLFGPRMENFRELAASLLASQGAIEVSDEHSLARTVSSLLADAALRSELAARGADALRPHQGATARTASLVESALDLV